MKLLDRIRLRRIPTSQTTRTSEPGGSTLRALSVDYTADPYRQCLALADHRRRSR